MSSCSPSTAAPGRQETLRVNGRAWFALGVEVEECFLHCAKAFVRSQLWETESWPDLATVRPASVRDAIVHTFGSRGLVCAGSATLEISINAAFADVPATTIRDLVARADSPEAEAIAIICTNLHAGWLVAELEQTHAKPVFDPTLVTIWHALRLVGISDMLDGWGDLFLQPLEIGPA